MKRAAACFLSLVVAALGGCQGNPPYRTVDIGTPPGQVVRLVMAQPREQTLGEKFFSGTERQSISCLDGKQTRSAPEAFVSPGFHYVQLSYSWSRERLYMSAHGSLWFEGLAGKTYAAHAAASNAANVLTGAIPENPIRFWIEDETGQIVGGVAGSEPTPGPAETRC